MKRDGITLIEIIIVISIIGILAVALGFNFAGWMARYKVESQIKTMHIDLMAARQRAMEKNIQYVAQLPSNGDSYTICEDTNGNNICDVPSETTNSHISQSLSKSGLIYPISSDLAGAPIIMNQRGLLMTPQSGVNVNIVSNNVWLLNPATMAAYGPTATNTANEVDYDCISLSATKIDMGKYNGVSCVAK